jgi:hypothetical protein
MSARPIPLVVKLHAVILTVLLGVNAWGRVGGRPGVRTAQSGDELAALGLGVVILAVLFFLMLGGKAWARIALGVLTLPLGLMLLWPQAAREFTDPHYTAEPSDGARILR